VMERLRNRLRWRRRAEQVRACGRLTPPGGLCVPCRELLAKRPAVVLKAESYPTATTDEDTTP
jgi:hypothetical protein